jgi:serine/threonine protein kinase
MGRLMRCGDDPWSVTKLDEAESSGYEFVLGSGMSLGSPRDLGSSGDETARSIDKFGPAGPICCRGSVPAEWPSVAGFEILAELGSGTMGVVYKARQVSLGRLVALKMVRAGARPDILAQFPREAQIVASLRHPNIVQLHEVGQSGGLPYCALEFIDGGTLAQQIKGRRPEIMRAACIIRTLARAIHAAHLQGIVHRDLKPSNILLTADGRLKIADFGLARRLSEDSEQTRPGTIVGTPNYMAPEQARGHAHEAGPLVDQHALGAILYELLTGRPPFQGATAFDTVQRVLTQEPAPPSRLQPRVPRDLETICLKCLEKEPQRRYADAAALADDLDRFSFENHPRPRFSPRANPPWGFWCIWCRESQPRRDTRASLPKGS